MPGHRVAGRPGSVPRFGSSEDDIRVADTAANTVHDQAGSWMGHAFGSDTEMTCLIRNQPKNRSLGMTAGDADAASIVQTRAGRRWIDPVRTQAGCNKDQPDAVLASRDR